VLQTQPKVIIQRNPDMMQTEKNKIFPPEQTPQGEGDQSNQILLGKAHLRQSP
jgi:hypothetical protein